MMWYSSLKRNDVVLDCRRGALLQEVIEVHPRPKPRDERIAFLGVCSETVLSKRTSLSPCRPVTTMLPDCSAPSRQITAQKDLLLAGGQIRQPLGIDPGHAQAGELHLKVTQGRPRDFLEQVQGDGPGTARR